ncbi:MAG: hypothetical protein HC810_02395 [Acaryochloridaceae cyanobacterium RL_2_7]|nr:hypothetical protein [Acaryochloridaceae cyanobacterium RL_2_7]
MSCYIRGGCRNPRGDRYLNRGFLMALRYCIHHHPENKTWIIEDLDATLQTSESDLTQYSFRMLLDAIHFMFSRGYGEFSIRK